MRKNSRFDQTRRARLSRVIFQQARKVLSGSCHSANTKSHSSSSRSILRRALGTSAISLNSKAFTAVMTKFGLSDTSHQRGRQTRSNRSQISQGQACQIERKTKTDPETMKPQSRLMCYLYHSQFLFFLINPVKSIY